MSFIGSTDRTRGTTSKLFCGGGEVVNHSSVLPFHGSGPATTPRLSERRTLNTVTRTPSRKLAMNAQQNSIGVRNSIVPRHSVAIQLKILTPVGTAMRNELIMKKTSTTVGEGVANMWCAHTSRPRKAMTTLAAATAL